MTERLDAWNQLNQAINRYVAAEKPENIPTEWVLVAGSMPTSPDGNPLTHLAHSQMTPHWRVNGLISTAGQMLRMDAGELE